MNSRPRRDPAATPPDNPIPLFQRLSVSPHETTPPPRPGSIPGRGRGRRADPAATPPNLTKHFTASTCRKCGGITIAGTTYGLRVDLEPTTLDDHTEYAALADNVPTYDLWPDRTARRRHLEEIKHPERVPRHAAHSCDRTYGTNPRPAPAVSPRPIDGPPPF